VILEAVRDHGGLTPKEASDLTDVSHDLAKKTMQRMFQDGQLAASNGSYSLPVPAVPESPDRNTGTENESPEAVPPGTEGHRGQAPRGDA
jgi:hypothetical protein